MTSARGVSPVTAWPVRDWNATISQRLQLFMKSYTSTVAVKKKLTFRFCFNDRSTMRTVLKKRTQHETSLHMAPYIRYVRRRGQLGTKVAIVDTRWEVASYGAYMYKRKWSWRLRQIWTFYWRPVKTEQANHLQKTELQWLWQPKIERVSSYYYTCCVWRSRGRVVLWLFEKN